MHKPDNIRSNKQGLCRKKVGIKRFKEYAGYKIVACFICLFLLSTAVYLWNDKGILLKEGKRSDKYGRLSAYMVYVMSGFCPVSFCVADDETTIDFIGDEDRLSVNYLVPESIEKIQKQNEGVIGSNDGNINKIMEAHLALYASKTFSEFVSANYIVDSSTCVNESIIDLNSFCEISSSMDKSKTILIYHTHGSEAFIDSDGTEHDTIMGAGDYLAELLKEKGYSVIHDKTYYDRKDGVENRKVAYSQGLEGLSSDLAEHPEIDVIIDLHRDSGEKRVVEIDGKKVAKVMMFNGLSYDSNGDISYLPNPNRTENLAISYRMKAVADHYYPGFMNRIYLKNYRFNMHLRGKSMLIETGTEENTVEEIYGAMPVLADCLDKVLSG